MFNKLREKIGKFILPNTVRVVDAADMTVDDDKKNVNAARELNIKNLKVIKD